MMIDKVKNHISVFGDKFVTTEFAFVALATGSVAFFFLVHAQFVLGFIASGITLNCLPMVAFGIRALVNREERRNPRTDEKQTLKDTLALSAAIIVPFILLVVTVYEKWNYDTRLKR